MTPASGPTHNTGFSFLFPWLLALMIIPLLVGAQENRWELEYLTINDGLSGNFVTQIHKDQLGYMWFGTMEGLNRYDGQQFVSFQHLPDDPLSLSDNFIRDLDEDQQGDLYLATNRAGLDHFDRRKEQFTHISLGDGTDRSFQSLAMVACINDTSLWIGTQDGYLLHYDPSRDTLDLVIAIPKDVPNTGENSVQDVYEDGSGWIYIASNLGGLDRIRYPQLQIEHVLMADPLEERFRRDGCNNIIADSEGTLWISRVSGLDSYHPRTGKHTAYGFKDSKSEMFKSFTVLPYPDGRFVLSSYYDMILFDPLTGEVESVAGILPQYFTSGLYVDADGIIWSGTMGYGAIKLDPDKRQFNTEPGNFLGEIYHRELELVKPYFAYSPNMRDRDFLSIIRDREGDTWIATDYWGLLHLDEVTGKVTKYSIGELDERQRYQVMYEVFEDHSGNIWVSTVGGMSKLDRKTGKFEYFRLYPGSDTDRYALNTSTYLDISCIHEDEAGLFWLGTPEMGVIRFDPRSGVHRSIPMAPSPERDVKSYPILSILPDPESPEEILWFGTEGAGLVRFNTSSETADFLTMENGLPNNTVNGLLPGVDQDIWMSTNLGLCRFKPSNGELQTFDVRDGLQSNGFNRREYWRSPEGELFFGGSYGYNHFFPDAIRTRTTPTPLVLTGVEVLNQPLDHQESNSPMSLPPGLLKDITLNHEQAMMVTFSYTSLCYSNAHRQRFVYQLEGFDETWIENGANRSATYTNIPPGSYTFKVRYQQEKQNALPQELTLAVRVLPPFWKTWWFRLLLGATLTLAIGMLIQRQLARQRKKHLDQQHFSRQLLASQEDERKRISGELHDGVGQNLLVIKNTIQLGLNQSQEPAPGFEYFESASDIVSETIQEVREISHNMSPQHLEQLGLTATLETIIENIARACEIHFDLVIEDIDELLPAEAEILVYRIVQEALNNMIKHSRADTAEVTIGRQGDQLLIRIKDNGVGFTPRGAVSRRGIGLSGMLERAQLAGGDLQIDSKEGDGTQVVLTIDLKDSK